MGFSLGRTIAFTLCAAVFLICSCDKHHPGEDPRIQRDKTQPAPPETANVETSTPASAPESTSTPAKPTPADFFPTKPR
jgi:hypothetical protein